MFRPIVLREPRSGVRVGIGCECCPDVLGSGEVGEEVELGGELGLGVGQGGWVVGY